MYISITILFISKKQINNKYLLDLHISTCMSWNKSKHIKVAFYLNNQIKSIILTSISNIFVYYIHTVI